MEGVSRPTPRGEVEGDLAGGCLLWGSCFGGSSLGGPALGVVPALGPPMTATAAGGTNPTGIHSCCITFPQNQMKFENNGHRGKQGVLAPLNQLMYEETYSKKIHDGSI